jgi:hypothetical protein
MSNYNNGDREGWDITLEARGGREREVGSLSVRTTDRAMEPLGVKEWRGGGVLSLVARCGVKCTNVSGVQRLVIAWSW